MCVFRICVHASVRSVYIRIIQNIVGYIERMSIHVIKRWMADLSTDELDFDHLTSHLTTISQKRPTDWNNRYSQNVCEMTNGSTYVPAPIQICIAQTSRLYSNTYEFITCSIARTWYFPIFQSICKYIFSLSLTHTLSGYPLAFTRKKQKNPAQFIGRFTCVSLCICSSLRLLNGSAYLAYIIDNRILHGFSFSVSLKK